MAGRVAMGCSQREVVEPKLGQSLSRTEAEVLNRVNAVFGGPGDGRGRCSRRCLCARGQRQQNQGDGECFRQRALRSTKVAATESREHFDTSSEFVLWLGGRNRRGQRLGNLVQI